MGDYQMKTLHIAENILKLRHAKRITQEEVANYLGVTKASVSKWENAQSIPDVTLLPQLAAYFGVTVDELLGYESQLAPEQIERIYEELSAGFAKGEIKETFVMANAYIRNHYSCHAFLSKMAMLFINHVGLLEDENERGYILNQTKKISKVILDESTIQTERDMALVCNAYADLMLGNAKEVVEALEPLSSAEVTSVKSTIDTLLIQAYQATGDIEKANVHTQICIFNSVMAEINFATNYLALNMGNLEVCKEVINRITKTINTYNVTKLNPNAVAVFSYQAACAYAASNETKAALELLDVYATAICELFTGEMLKVKADSFFNKLEDWATSNSDTTVPRDRKLIAKDSLNGLNIPLFDSIRNTTEFERVVSRIKVGTE